MQDVFEALIAREKLGSTGFGNGIAIPHCRLKGCTSPISALLHLEAPIDFDAIDGAPVDLLFVLLVPEAATDAHLELLRQIASMLDRKEVREKLRSAPSNEALYQVVLDEQNGH
jgi:PTS system nitrogen regulatory IIA component